MTTLFHSRQRSGAASGPRADEHRGERGVTLLELVFATFILLVILLGIVPLFLRAIHNNTYGGEATRLTSLSREALEQDRSRSVNSAAHIVALTEELDDDPDAPPSTTDPSDLAEFVTGGPLFYDTGPKSGGLDAYVGDEVWRENREEIEGIAILRRQDRYTAYSFSDVFQGTVSTAGDGTATTVGDPYRFDSPLSLEQVQAIGGAEMQESNVAIDLERQNASVGVLQKVRIGTIRTM